MDPYRKDPKDRSAAFARALLVAELAFLTFGLPVLLGTVIPLRFMLVTVWLIALYGYLVWRAQTPAPRRLWRWGHVSPRGLRPLLARFAIATILIAGITYGLHRELFLSFVRERPVFWAVVMIAYPVLSAIPQEIIFRSFFFARYRPVFSGRWPMIVASGVAFAVAHVIFQNWIAPALCLVGGLMFAKTYDETRSLALVTIEHALYGCMIFTVGLGRFFYHGAVGAH